jgi:hypothetical protein
LSRREVIRSNLLLDVSGFGDSGIEGCCLGLFLLLLKRLLEKKKDVIDEDLLAELTSGGDGVRCFCCLSARNSNCE